MLGVQLMQMLTPQLDQHGSFGTTAPLDQCQIFLLLTNTGSGTWWRCEGEGGSPEGAPAQAHMERSDTATQSPGSD